MTSIDKLKDRARKHEQKEDWQAAITAYQEVLQVEEGDDEAELELGLYNRVGDLYLRLGRTDQAVSYYEQAADRYADSGFYNNAIALCNKALRHRPERPALFLKLSRLCAEQGFMPDARRWILGYVERELKAGRVAEALTGLEDFADLSGDPDVREILAQHLATHERSDEAVDQLREAHATWLQRGDAEAAERAADRARELDPDVDLDTGAAAAGTSGLPGLPGLDEPEPAGAAPEAPGEDLEDSLELRSETEPDEAAGVGLEGLESHRADTAPTDETDQTDETGETDELEGFDISSDGDLDEAEEEAAEAGAGPEEDVALEEELEIGPAAEATEPDEAAADTLGGLETFDSGAGVAEEEEEEAEPLPLLDEEFGDEEEEGEPLPLLDEADAPVEEPTPEPAVEEPVEAPVPEEEPPAETPAPEEPVAEEPAAEEPAAEVETLPDEPAEEEPAELDLGGGFTPADELDPDMVPSADEVPEDAIDLDVHTLDLGGDTDEAEAPDAEPAVEDVDVEAVLERARELVARGLTDAALPELRLISHADAPAEAHHQALQVVAEIVRKDPNDTAALQCRVEIAARTDDPEILVEAYLELADALARLGSEVKAQAMYERVLDIDPENEAARDALGTAAEAGDEEPMDLDAILREMDPDARAAIEGADETDPEFAAMLSQFKAKVDEHMQGDDAGDHYDLGLAFKEMGLIDEAIGEFQTALNSGGEHLRVYEELGQCYIQQGQYNVALKILTRALKVPREDEAELLGVYYHLGQCHEELGQREDARDAYEKVLSIDDSFQDVPARVARL